MQTVLVPVRTAETILDELEEIYDHITQRAYEISVKRGGLRTLDVEDWLAAEQELLFKPEVRVEEAGQQITVTVRIGDVRPMDVQLLVTPDAMVIQADLRWASKKAFRTVEFPHRIVVRKAEARYENGCLIVTA